jgi:hypothetical protein
LLRDLEQYRDLINMYFNRLDENAREARWHSEGAGGSD